MNKTIDGSLVSGILFEELNKYLDKKQLLPTIVDISIGEDFGNKMYSKMKEKTITSKTPIKFISKHFDKISYIELREYIESLNKETTVTGIMIQLPLPSNLKEKEREILDTINPKKDIDGLTSKSINNLIKNQDTLVPCTALGIKTLLKAYDISLKGKKIAILNRSNIVGKPLEQLMIKEGATPIVCHSKTKNIKAITKECDIVVVAINKQEYITENFIKDQAIVIDVGVHKNKEGKIVGDVDFKNIYQKTSLITPPTGAVGPMTICMFAYNSAKSIYGKEINQIIEKGIKKAKVEIKRGDLLE